MASIARTFIAAKPAAFRMAATPVARSSFRTFTTTRMSLLRKYTKDHEWIDLSADKKSAVVGISDYASHQLGDVVYVELPEDRIGEIIQKGDAIGAVESVKSASDINAPVRLKLIAVNKLLDEKPSIINQVPEDDSHGGGWIAKVELDEDGAKQAEELMDTEAYKAYTEAED
ncbi:hypothetical protein N3K66_007126 [Trichothecium roseum]|uniref:Uncharacterized protein n=1 Tax=Trichothecium roseum TaxID=47278 RepID=A0ACC0UXB4_9HYPO|nr:hypothetical protein N3K66_007126 [Trichothecium roseum]